MKIQAPQQPTAADDAAAEWWPPVWALMVAQEPTPPRVLVAESRPELRLQIGHALREAGMDADFAASSDEAQEMVRRQHYDVAVLNPDLDANGGESLCRSLMRDTGHGTTPVITLSDRDSPMNQIRSLMSRAQARLVRPVSSDRFVGTVWRMARGS